MTVRARACDPTPSQAAKRRAEKQAGSDIYEKQKKKAEAEAKAEHEAQRAKMAERRKLFEGK